MGSISAADALCCGAEVKHHVSVYP